MNSIVAAKPLSLTGMEARCHKFVQRRRMLENGERLAHSTTEAELYFDCVGERAGGFVYQPSIIDASEHTVTPLMALDHVLCRLYKGFTSDCFIACS